MEGKTALHWATVNKNGAIAQYLLQVAKEAGNSKFAGIVDLEGRTALHLAIGGGVTDVVVKLLDNGADAKVSKIGSRC